LQQQWLTGAWHPLTPSGGATRRILFGA